MPYVNVGAETTRRDYVTSVGAGPAWGEAGTSVATVVGLAVVSVLAFWLIVTVVVLSCLLARRHRTSAKPRTGCVVDNRWSWSGNQLIGLLDDAVDAPENARLFSTDHFDLSPPGWNRSPPRREGSRTFTAYRSLRRRVPGDEYRPPRPLDSGYDTLAAAAAILDASEMGETPPEVTSYEPMEVWRRQRVTEVGCGGRRPAGDPDVTVSQPTSQRRFPRMGQS